MSRLFGDDFITQKYLRRYPDSQRAKSWAGVPVHIQTENGVWRTGGSGYTWAGKPDAWIIAFEQAARQIDHCGPEKCGKFLRAQTPMPATSLSGRVVELEAENKRLREMLAGCEWYWPEDDTSSDACADGPWQIAENIEAKPGDVFAYSRGGIVETRYYGYLEPDESADSDDQFEADEATREAAESKLAAEIARRAALSATATEGE